MNNVIVADNQSLFRTGAVKLLSRMDGIRVVSQCLDTTSLIEAIALHRESIVLYATSLGADRQRIVREARSAASKVIAVLGNNENPALYAAAGVDGMIFRSSEIHVLLACVSSIRQGGLFLERSGAVSRENDLAGIRLRDSLTERELEVVALLVQGCKNKEIARKLDISSQRVKNYLRSIFDKADVEDRVEMVLFALHNRVFAAAIRQATGKLVAEAWAASRAIQA